MEESHLRIEPHPFRCRDTIVHHQRIEKRHERIDGIGRRTPVAAIQLERLAILSNHAVEGGKIVSGRLAFNPAQRIQVLALGKPCHGVAECVNCFSQGICIRWNVSLPRASQDDLAGVLNLSRRRYCAQWLTSGSGHALPHAARTGAGHSR